MQTYNIHTYIHTYKHITYIHNYIHTYIHTYIESDVGRHAYSQLSARLSAGFVALAAGGDHTCALLAGGGVDCWGFNGNGQLGTGDTSNRHTPTGVMGLGEGGQWVTACENTFSHQPT